jgi:hypothetical protein
MELIFSGSVSKDYSRPYENEDVFDVDFVKHSVRIALSDGATISYDSKNWAKALVGYLIQRGVLSTIDMKKIIKAYYADRFDFDDMTLIQKRGFSYGSFATLLGIEYSEIDDNIYILAVGDSIAVLLDQNSFVDSFPYSSSKQFDRNPQMLSIKKRNNFFFSRTKKYSKFYETWNISVLTRPVLLCMTDALGEWALREMESGNSSVWREILSIDSIKKLKQFVQDGRNERMMKVDDTTLISIKL